MLTDNDTYVQSAITLRYLLRRLQYEMTEAIDADSAKRITLLTESVKTVGEQVLMWEALSDE